MTLATGTATETIARSGIVVMPPRRSPKESDETYRLRSVLIGLLIEERVNMAALSGGEISVAVGNALSVARALEARKFKTGAEYESFLLNQIRVVRDRSRRFAQSTLSV